MTETATVPSWIAELRGEPTVEEQAGSTPALQRRFLQRMLVRALEQQAEAASARTAVESNTKALHALQRHLDIRARELSQIEARVISSTDPCAASKSSAALSSTPL